MTKKYLIIITFIAFIARIGIGVVGTKVTEIIGFHSKITD